ncbi:MAG: HAD family hydrolase [Butyrivibrio sp.]|nr:HAD family hydrolase [Butyrivibrio sp.]
MKKEFDNYIFDLYGTLIDIHTDEEKEGLWQEMAEYLMANFGVSYKSEALRKRYVEICAEEEKKLKAKNGADFPEIRIENVWGRLISEGKSCCEKASSDTAAACGNTLDTGESESNVFATVDLESKEIRNLCIFFRESSRDKLVVYEGVKDTLDKLKAMGKGIFLLSNAQRAFTEKELEDTGLTDYFDDIFISSDKEIKKPQKEFLELLVRKNGLFVDKCVMIGNDIFSDVGVAFKNGMNSVFLNTYDFTEKKIDRELSELGIKGSELMPVIAGDGDIRSILPGA